MEIFADHSIEFIIMFFGGLIILGCFAGFLAGLLGIGGGVVLVPGLYAVFSVLGYEHESLMHLCVGTSLAIIVPTGYSAARSHFKRGSCDMALLKQIGIGIALGVLSGTTIASALEGETLKAIFAVTISILAIIMLIDPKRFTLISHMPKQPVPAIAGFVIGNISTLIGIGGATLSVPFMSLCKTPIRTAIGTASGLGLVISIPAAIGFIIIGWNTEGLPPFSFGFVNVAAWLAIIPFSVLVAPLGSRMTHAVPVDLMRKGFAGFMILVSIKMISSLMGA